MNINKELIKKAKNDFKTIYFKLMNNLDFGETIENVRKDIDKKLLKTEARMNYLVLEPNYHTSINFTEDLLAIDK